MNLNIEVEITKSTREIFFLIFHSKQWYKMRI